MLEVVITTSQNSCSTDFENESEKKQIAVNAYKTRVKSPGLITLSSAVFNSAKISHCKHGSKTGG